MALFDFLKRKRKREEPARADGLASPASPNRGEPGQGGRVVVKEEKALPREKKIIKEVVSERMLADIIRPHITERSRESSQGGAYVFRVAEGATKHTIKQAIEAIYRVAVQRVRVTRIPSKPRRRGLTRGTKKGYKKAAVTLRKGEHIELFS